MTTGPHDHALQPPPTFPSASGAPYMGTIFWHGLVLLIEQAAYATRRGVAPDGEPWASMLVDHYGEIQGTQGNDGDALDVFVGRSHEATEVYAIAIAHPDGTFDEVKLMLDYASPKDALSAFVRSYDRVPTVLRMSAWPVREFVRRVVSGEGIDDWRRGDDLRRVLVKGTATVRFA